MQHSKLLTIASILFAGISCAPVPKAGISERGESLINGIPKDGPLTKGGPLSAADEGYIFHISWDDAGELGLDPALDKNILKNPILAHPLSTTPTKGLHSKRQKSNLAADDAYTFHVSFDDAGKMVMDPVFNKDILEKHGMLDNAIKTKPMEGQH